MRQLFFLGMVFVVTLQCHAQTAKKQNAFDKWRQDIHEDFDNFREEILNEYIDFVRNPWKEFKSNDPISTPKEEPVPPTVIPKKDKDSVKPTAPTPKPIIIKEVIRPVKPTPQPTPVVPLITAPVVKSDSIVFTFFGTRGAIITNRIASSLKIKDVSSGTVADALKVLTSSDYDAIISDCLALRERCSLCDWAYLEMLQKMANVVCGEGTNESVLLTSYVFMRSGYKVRLAHDDSKLYLLFTSPYHLYDKTYFNVDGENYYGLEQLPAYIKICQAPFRGERSLSMAINTRQKFDNNLSTERLISSYRYPDVVTKTEINKNLIDFYDTYPTSMINDNFCTRWALYANTPMSKNVTDGLYPQIKAKIEGKTQYDALNRILNWVQTGLTYEYDSKVWGGDRAFFAEESLYYPYCDCEDRSILLTRIVRDIMGLKCLLVYYPGHLSAAIEIADGSAHGDYIEYEGHKYTIADGTIIGCGANAGVTMTGMDNTTATVILLQ